MICHWAHASSQPHHLHHQPPYGYSDWLRFSSSENLESIVIIYSSYILDCPSLANILWWHSSTMGPITHPHTPTTSLVTYQKTGDQAPSRKNPVTGGCANSHVRWDIYNKGPDRKPPRRVRFPPRRNRSLYVRIWALYIYIAFCSLPAATCNKVSVFDVIR